MTQSEIHKRLGEGEPLKLSFGIRKRFFYIGDKPITERQFYKARADLGSLLEFSSTHNGLTDHFYHLKKN